MVAADRNWHHLNLTIFFWRLADSRLQEGVQQLFLSFSFYGYQQIVHLLFAPSDVWYAAKKTILDAAHKVMETDFPDCKGPEDMYFDVAYTGTLADAQEWIGEVEAAFPGYPIHADPLSLSVACHIGPVALAITLTKVLKP